MPRIPEETLIFWTRPPSETEEVKLQNSERMVRDAIAKNEKLKKKPTETFGQGSYANDTNVRLNSDVDINVRYTGAFFYDLPTNKSANDIGIQSDNSGYTYYEYKLDVENALVSAFGRQDVIRNDKCITIKGNTYRVQIDVVPTWNYRRYKNDGSFVLGAKFWSESNVGIVNFPKQHIENGINKNRETAKRFKRLTRIYRRLRIKMKDDGVQVNDSITSFLLECLVFNVPNRIFNESESWTDRLRLSIIFIYTNTTEESKCKEWLEVSELLYLFHPGRKWTREDVNNFMLQAWTYLEYK